MFFVIKTELLFLMLLALMMNNTNDYYSIIDDDEIITSFKLEIFNRFGEKVYSSENVNDKLEWMF